jgi:hypothetical protein
MALPAPATFHALAHIASVVDAPPVDDAAFATQSAFPVLKDVSDETLLAAYEMCEYMQMSPRAIHVVVVEWAQRHRAADVRCEALDAHAWQLWVDVGWRCLCGIHDVAFHAMRISTQWSGPREVSLTDSQLVRAMQGQYDDNVGWPTLIVMAAFRHTAALEALPPDIWTREDRDDNFLGLLPLLAASWSGDAATVRLVRDRLSPFDGDFWARRVMVGGAAAAGSLDPVRDMVRSEEMLLFDLPVDWSRSWDMAVYGALWRAPDTSVLADLMTVEPLRPSAPQDMLSTLVYSVCAPAHADRVSRRLPVLTWIWESAPTLHEELAQTLLSCIQSFRERHDSTSRTSLTFGRAAIEFLLARRAHVDPAQLWVACTTIESGSTLFPLLTAAGVPRSPDVFASALNVACLSDDAGDAGDALEWLLTRGAVWTAQCCDQLIAGYRRTTQTTLCKRRLVAILERVEACGCALPTDRLKRVKSWCSGALRTRVAAMIGRSKLQ